MEKKTKTPAEIEAARLAKNAKERERKARLKASASKPKAKAAKKPKATKAATKHHAALADDAVRLAVKRAIRASGHALPEPGKGFRGRTLALAKRLGIRVPGFDPSKA